MRTSLHSRSSSFFKERGGAYIFIIIGWNLLICDRVYFSLIVNICINVLRKSFSFISGGAGRGYT